MRTAAPFEAVSPAARAADAPVVGTAPTLLTRRVHGDQYLIGLEVFGTKGLTVEIQHPYAGQGLISPNFPYYQPSSVAPDLIRPPILLTRNNHSPVSHAEFRQEFSKTIPAPARKPGTKLPYHNSRSRRGGGGAYTYPSPFAASDWPTSSQWLASQVRAGLSGGQ